MCKEEYGKAIDSAVFPGNQGGPLMHVIAAKAICFGEALKPSFKEYQAQVISNASALAGSLCEFGFHLVSGGSDNHLMLVDLRPSHPTSPASRLRSRWKEPTPPSTETPFRVKPAAHFKPAA